MSNSTLISKLDNTQLQYTAGAVVLVAIAGILLRLAYPSSSKQQQQKRRKDKMEVTVKWGKERLRVPLPALDTPLGDFRKTLADTTGLPPDSFKLIYSGAVLKDNSAPLSAFRIKPGCTLAIIGGSELPPPPGHASAPVKEKPTEASTIASIRSEVSTLQTSLEPQVTAFLDWPPQEQGSRQVTHTMLSELILQVLLRLDAMTVEGWDEARKERRAAVKLAQEMLTKLDDGWKKMKTLEG